MDHRSQIRLAIGFVAAAAFAQDASRTLEEARDKILRDSTHLPKLVCVETIDRSYFSRGEPLYPLPSCEQIAIDRKKGRNKPKLDYTDRVRVAVAIAGQREIFSWTGTAPASYSVEDVLNPGPIGTGAFAAHLLDIFSNPSVRFRLLQETADTIDYGFQVPVEASHYSIGAGGNWLPTGYSGSFRMERESRNIGRFTVETNELPPETSACEMSSVLEFGDGTGWSLPTKSTTHDVLRDASETDSVTTISDCHPSSAASPALSSGRGAPLDPGIVLTLLFDAPIDFDVAAAGDVISASITEAYFAGTKDVKLPQLEGAAVSGRIARVEHRMAHSGQPAVFRISVAFETLEVSGVASPFYAKLLGRPPGTLMPVPERGAHPPPIGHGENDWSATFVFASRAPRFVVEMPFYSKWLTMAPNAVH